MWCCSLVLFGCRFRVTAVTAPPPPRRKLTELLPMVGRSDVDLDQLDTHTFYCKVMCTTATNSGDAEEAAAVAHDPPRPQQLSSGALATKIVEAVSRRMLCFLNRSLRRVFVFA